MQGPCGGREYHLPEDSRKVKVAMERAKIGAGLGGPQGLCPYLKSKDDTQGRLGGGQEGIQFHNVGCGTRRHLRKSL